ncbi:MAG: PIN domain-containing protein [Flavobacteriales bacterium]|nr:PIN domain-containing protein [Flavobacteriales bacterium]
MRDDIFVLDTNAILSYFSSVFNSEISISKESIEIIDLAFHSTEIKLIIPSTVFIEIYIKWIKTQEIGAKIFAEVFYRIKERENMQIRLLDKETLENYMKIVDIEDDHNFDSHDKQIYAAAMTMECSLISSDEHLIRYNKRKKFLLQILS